MNNEENINPKITEVEEGKPLRIHELDIENLVQWMGNKKIRTSQGKLIQPLFEAQKEIVNDPARFKVVACGRRFSKTLLTSLIAFSVLMQTNRRVWIAAPNYSLTEKVFREIYNILVYQLKIIIPGKQGKARNQKGDYYLETPWGSVLEAKSMENPDSLVGDAVDLLVIDEAAIEPKLEDLWIQMLQPILMDKKGSAIFISTPRGKNSYYKLYTYGELGVKQRLGSVPVTKDEITGIDNDCRDWSSFKKTSYDNPLIANTPEESKSEIDAAYRRSILAGKVQKFKQEYLADFESTSDLCFPEFVKETTKEKPFSNIADYSWHPNEGPVYASCDHNYARPASTLFAQINHYNDIIIFDEAFTKNTDSYKQARQIQQKEKDLNKIAIETWAKEGKVLAERQHIHFSGVIADISGNQVQLSGRTAWDDFEAVLGYKPVGLKQSRETGCNMIRLWLQFPKFDEKGRPVLTDKKEQITYPKLFINRSCINLIYAIQTAAFRKSKAGSLKEDYEETPEGYEGLLDALRYLLVYLFHDRGQYINIVQGII
jgi:Terminase large subunit, T4likevirus-type, N-terminal